MFYKILPTPCVYTNYQKRKCIYYLPLLSYWMYPIPLPQSPHSTNLNTKGSPQKGKDQAPVSSSVENQYHIIAITLWINTENPSHA